MHTQMERCFLVVFPKKSARGHGQIVTFFQQMLSGWFMGHAHLCFPLLGACAHPASFKREKEQRALRSTAALRCWHSCQELRRAPTPDFLCHFFKCHLKLPQGGLLTFSFLACNCSLVALLKYLVL